MGSGIALQFILFQKSLIEVNYPVLILLVTGLAFLFSPDTIITAIQTIIKKKSDG